MASPTSESKDAAVIISKMEIKKLYLQVDGSGTSLGILGLSRSGHWTLEDYKIVYRSLALRLHPDKCSSDQTDLHTRLFKIVQNAYEDLCEKGERPQKSQPQESQPYESQPHESQPHESQPREKSQEHEEERSKENSGQGYWWRPGQKKSGRKNGMREEYTYFQHYNGQECDERCGGRCRYGAGHRWTFHSNFDGSFTTSAPAHPEEDETRESDDENKNTTGPYTRVYPPAPKPPRTPNVVPSESTNEYSYISPRAQKTRRAQKQEKQASKDARAEAKYQNAWHEQRERRLKEEARRVKTDAKGRRNIIV